MSKESMTDELTRDSEIYIDIAARSIHFHVTALMRGEVSQHVFTGWVVHDAKKIVEAAGYEVVEISEKDKLLRSGLDSGFGARKS
jgi:hypothetical protein